MAHLFLACPKCGAAYRIAKEHAQTEVVCRTCKHRWVPGAPSPSAPAAEAPAQPSSPAKPPASAAGPKKEVAPEGEIGSPLDALAALADAARGPKGGKAKARTPPGEPSPAAPRSAADPLAEMAQAASAAKGQLPSAAKAPRAAGPKAAKAARSEKTDPLVGTHVNGFDIQGRIGSGGFGVVYRAFDTNLERSVAIKMLPPKIAQAGQSLVDRFLREARSAAKLAHPNIVTIHQICPYKDTYYIVMELVDGGSLHEYLASQRRLKPAEATRIVRAAAEGLGHAHRRGIIHRDIKPGNIMLTGDGQVKVSDFGLARDVLQGEDIVGAGHSLGTPRYMAPEQALGEEPTASSDLYSLAATYYVLLTGRAAFDGEHDREIMRKQVQAPVPDPRQVVPDLPVAAFRFFEKAMAKQPEDRFVKAEEFVEALDRLDFSGADADASDSQALINQLGAISAEDRGAHLQQALGRAVRRAQRQRTPMPERAVEDVLGAGSVAARKSGWKLWLLIGAVVVLLLIGAVVAAIILAGKSLRSGIESAIEEIETTAVETPTPSGETPTPSGETPTPSGETPTPSGETPTPSGETPKPPVPPPTNPLEEVAREVLKEVEAYEADPETPTYDLIRMYQENVINVYPGTKAATDAKNAIARLRTGKRLGGEEGATEKPPAEQPPAEEPPAEQPEETPGDAPGN